MPQDGQAGNSAAAVAEPPAQAGGQSAAPVSTGTQNQNGQAATQAQSAPAEESFSNIDPKTLPPELQGVYKNLQADYTKKTQSIADARKKADAYEKISKDQRFVDYWNGLNRTQKAEKKAEVEKTVGQKISDKEFAEAFQSKEGFLALQEKIAQMAFEKSQKEVETLKQQVQTQTALNIVDSFSSEKDAQGNLLRPDFDELDKDTGLISGFLQVYPPEQHTEEAYLARLNEAYSWAKTVSQKFYEKGKQEALARMQEKAQTSTNPPTNAAKGAYTGPDPKKLSPREAMELAKKGIRVPRDD